MDNIQFFIYNVGYMNFSGLTAIACRITQLTYSLVTPIGSVLFDYGVNTKCS